MLLIPVCGTSLVAETTGVGLTAEDSVMLAVSPLANDFVSVPAVTDGKSSAVALINTTAEPLRLIALFELLLSLTVRDRVVPEAVYVPLPISKLLPSSMTYLTVSPLDTPPPAKV